MLPKGALLRKMNLYKNILILLRYFGLLNTSALVEEEVKVALLTTRELLQDYREVFALGVANQCYKPCLVNLVSTERVKKNYAWLLQAVRY